MVRLLISAASQAVNQHQLLSAWSVGGYVSTKLKTQQWGSKVVTQFVEYVKVNAPELRGYSRRNIYNMVMFYDEYSSPIFIEAISKYLPNEIVQTVTGQLPKILTLISLSNHIDILNECKSAEERLFYVLYANREKLIYRELQRCISNGTYASLLGTKHNLSKGMLDPYWQIYVPCYSGCWIIGVLSFLSYHPTEIWVLLKNNIKNILPCFHIGNFSYLCNVIYKSWTINPVLMSSFSKMWIFFCNHYRKKFVKR